MAIFSTYDRIMNCVRSSNLNFACQETPYSLYLTIRKSKVKNDNKQSSSPVIGNYEVESLVKENLSLRERLRNLENKLDAFEDTNKMLEEKLASAEGKVLKAYKENLKNEDEMKNLRNVIKDNNNDISKLKCEKKEVMKEMKKKVHDLDKSNLAHKNSIESLKQDVKKQKDEKSRLEKQTKQLEKKIKSGKHENEIDSNRNIPPDFHHNPAPQAQLHLVFDHLVRQHVVLILLHQLHHLLLQLVYHLAHHLHLLKVSCRVHHHPHIHHQGNHHQGRPVIQPWKK